MLEAVRRIDALFDVERSINDQSAGQRRAVRQELSAPRVADLERWLREQRPKLSRGNDLAKAMDYMLKRWPAFTRFLVLDGHEHGGRLVCVAMDGCCMMPVFVVNR